VPETVTVECGFCRKHFRCPPELRDRPVRCPFCKTVTKIPASTEAARQAAGAISDMIAVEKADREKVPLAARHRVAPPTRGVRSKEMLIVWLGALGLGLIAGGIGIYWLYASGPQAETNSASAAKAVKSSPAAPKPEKRSSSARGAAAVAQASARAPASGAKEAAASAAALTPEPPPEAVTVKGDAASTEALAPEPPEEGVTVKVEGLLRGFKDSTITYAVGHVKNNTNGTLKVVKVIVRIADKADKELGMATQVLLNLPAGATAPLVAELQHAEGVMGRKWMPGYELTPMGVPQGLPPVAARDAIAVRDPNASATTGRIKVLVVNRGALPLPQVQFYAILTAPDGKIVGAAKATVDQTIAPNKPQEVTFPWVNCPGSLVQGVEVWAQAGL
jgi:hypothetical protein